MTMLTMSTMWTCSQCWHLGWQCYNHDTADNVGNVDIFYKASVSFAKFQNQFNSGIEEARLSSSKVFLYFFSVLLGIMFFVSDVMFWCHVFCFFGIMFFSAWNLEFRTNQITVELWWHWSLTVVLFQFSSDLFVIRFDIELKEDQPGHASGQE